MRSNRFPTGVWMAAGGVVALLLAVAKRYGFHRDEVYFVVAGRNLDWGYVDQPPFVPLVARLAEAIGGLESPFWLRVLPALAVGAVALLAASMARRFGGGPFAQTLAGFGVGWVGVLLGEGHLLSTAVFDFLVWAIALWIMVILLDGGDRRWWFGLGAVIGFGLQVKHTAALLAAALLAGILLTDRRRLLASPLPWAAAGLATLTALPNLLWQAANDWPQLEMIRALGARSDGPLAFVLLQPALLSIAMTVPAALGFWWLLRSEEARRWRPIALAYTVLFVLFVVTGGKAYYIAPMYTALIAAGAVVVERFGQTARRWMVGATAVGLFVGMFIGLPLLPVDRMSALDATGELSETVGWPELIEQLEAVYATVPESGRDATVIFTGTYGEAGAVAVLGENLPQAYSGHNSFWSWGPPPEHGAVIGVGYVDDVMNRICPAVEAVATISNPYGVVNEEAGLPIFLCLDPVSQLAEIWPEVRHYN